jgi:hypothetical protein
VARYYDEMEQGLLPAGGVSDRALDALGQILGETAERLRDAGRSLAIPAGGPDVALAALAYSMPIEAAPAARPAAAAVGGSGWDEVDQLFRGG